MGQKVHPIGFRLGVSKDWVSKWYAEGKDYANFLEKDFEVREFIRKKLAHASVSQIQIERPRNGAQITIFTARPGIVIGRKGEDIEVLKQEISSIMGVPTSVNIEEIRRPELDAYLVADGIAKQLERRVMFRRAMKRSVASTMRLGAAGIKVSIAGRLNGAEIARTEWYREGRVPLHTLRADIDYGFAEAHTTYGVIGVKVWIFKGENLEGLDGNSNTVGEAPEEKRARPKRTKFRKQHKGRNRGLAQSGNEVSFGEYGLKATTRGRITARQIEAARRAINRHVKRGGKMWIRIFPDVPVTNKPLETRQGKGKGNVEYWVAKVQPGTVMYELEGVTEELAREAFRLAAAKLPVRTVFETRKVM